MDIKELVAKRQPRKKMHLLEEIIQVYDGVSYYNSFRTKRIASLEDKESTLLYIYIIGKKRLQKSNFI